MGNEEPCAGHRVTPWAYLITSPNTLQVCDLETTPLVQPLWKTRINVLPSGRERPTHSQRGGTCNGSWSWEEAKSSKVQWCQGLLFGKEQ